jgi:anti-anti-sigma factor
MTTDETYRANRNRSGPAAEPVSDVMARIPLTISCQQFGSRAVIELSGELDLQESGRLTEQLQELLPQGVNRLAIDAARVTFTDSAGLRAVLWARTEAQAQGVDFQITALSPKVERVIDLAGLRDLLLGP